MHLGLSHLRKQLCHSPVFVLVLVLVGNAKLKRHEIYANGSPSTSFPHLLSSNSWNSV